MNVHTHLEISTFYNNWLAKNFHEEINTNPFHPEYTDDIYIVHDTDPYDYLEESFDCLEESFDYLEESFDYNNGFDDSMFNEEPNLDLHSDNEDDEVFDYTF